MNLSVLFTPSEFAALSERRLESTACVVFDILRATSTLVTALAHGAESILPVVDIPQALEARALDSSLLLAGERGGERIKKALTGSIDFDLGNSPREFTEARVRNRMIAMTTTNGTRALKACQGAAAVLACSFLNLSATARYLQNLSVDHVILVCAGTGENGASEDTLGAGALCRRLEALGKVVPADDSVWMAASLYDLVAPKLVQALARSQNGRRLTALPDLAADVEGCAATDLYNLVASTDPDGRLRTVVPL